MLCFRYTYLSSPFFTRCPSRHGPSIAINLPLMFWVSTVLMIFIYLTITLASSQVYSRVDFRATCMCSTCELHHTIDGLNFDWQIFIIMSFETLIYCMIQYSRVSWKIWCYGQSFSVLQTYLVVKLTTVRHCDHSEWSTGHLKISIFMEAVL